MEQKKKKLSKGKIRAIIVAAVSCAVALALIITNFFVPVKYLASYFVLHNKGAAEGVMRVRFVDVGYGDCTIVELPDGKNMLIDCGDGRSVNQKRILKFLNQCDIDTIDYLVCTSVNNEHCGGFDEIIQYKKVKTIYMPYCLNTYVTDGYRDFVLAANSSNAEKKIIEYGAGEANEEYNYFFVFLSPSIHTNPEGEYANLNANPSSESARNSASAVMWLQYGDTGFLFTGDASVKVQTKICEELLITDGVVGDYKIDFHNSDVAKIVKVANHGNANSACAPLYDFIKPEAAVISVGQNGNGCPSLEVISDAAKYAGDKLYRTDERGTVTFEVTRDGYAVI
ncbi:MAG: MBL fold metallo-hydrolase [Clostridia bacterium]|nr:MBL fold metallo-hydrolase [Clostridia bacterium]